MKARILNHITSSFLDYPSPIDNCLIVTFMGCSHNCVNCQNPQFKDYNFSEGTKSITVDDLISDLQTLSMRNRTNKIVLSGGDPLSIGNIDFTKTLISKSPFFDFCIYTGHNLEYIQAHKITADYIKCGNFIPTLKQESFKTDDFIQFASCNQKLYNKDYCLLSENGLYLFNK